MARAALTGSSLGVRQVPGQLGRVTLAGSVQGGRPLRGSKRAGRHDRLDVIKFITSHDVHDPGFERGRSAGLSACWIRATDRSDSGVC